MLLVALQLLVALAICEADGGNVLSQEAPSSNFAGEHKLQNYELGYINLLLCTEEDWGDGLKVLSTFRPHLCEHKAKAGDVIHYHYVGRLGDSGTIFGRRYILFP